MSPLIQPAIFRFFPFLMGQVPWVKIVPRPTPVQRMKSVGKRWGMQNLFVKREDFTDSVYGGNKVRNLEFLLGAAKERRASKLVTIGPLGSNFIAALAAQARKFSMPVEVHHFVPARSPQIEAHSQFILSQGADLRIHPGRIGTVPAGIGAANSMLFSNAPMWVSPGGSSVTGALGHVSALAELLEQVENRESPFPDTIVVGAGTCGTMAGLTAAIRALRLNIRLIGVRCVDRVVCNQRAIARLANQTLRKLGSSTQVSASDIELIDPDHQGYGKPLEKAADNMRMFQNEEGIRLDTTYTTKVISKMSALAAEGAFQRKSVIYWHTFSASIQSELA